MNGHESRLRQFHQIGIETVGVAGPQADIEVVRLVPAFFQTWLQRTALQLNTPVIQKRSVAENLVTPTTKRLDELSQEIRDQLNQIHCVSSFEGEGDRRVVADTPSFTIIQTRKVLRF